MRASSGVLQMQAKRHRALPLLTTGVLICLVGIGLKLVLDFWESQALSRLAHRLEIEPSWADFEDYLSETFTIGMTRDEVLQEAAEIGPYTLEPKSGKLVHEETIVFDLSAMGFHPLVSQKHSWLVPTYDANETLVRIYLYEPNLW